MNRTVCISLLLFFALISCNQENWKYAETKYNINKQLKLKIDSIEIKLDSISLPEYLSKSAILEKNDSIDLYVYNAKIGNIDIFHLNNTNKIDHISLSREGANAVLDVMSLQVISKDSIFIYDGINYLLLNSNGNIFWKRKGLFEKDNKLHFLESAFFTKLFYSTEQKRIYGRYMSTEKGYPYPEKDLFAYYDLNQDTLVTMPIEAPQYIINNHLKMGRNSTLHAFFYNDKICYNYSGISDIFIYDIKSQKNNTFGGKSNLIKENIIPYNGDSNDGAKKWIHFLETTNYNPIVFNPQTNLYYRLSFNQFIKEKDYSSMGHFNKNIYLTVFNSNFEIIHEDILPNHKFNFLDYFPVKNGILTFGNNPLNQNMDYEKMIFYKIVIE